MKTSLINIPPRLTEAEVLELTGFTKKTLESKMHRGQFPKKLWWCKRYGRVFQGEAAYRALGILQDKDEDPFYDAING